MLRMELLWPRLATGSIDGTLVVFDSSEPVSSSFTCTFRFRVHEASIVKVMWVPPEYGDAVACIFADGTLSLWEEVVEDYASHMNIYKITGSGQLIFSFQAEFQNVIDSLSMFGKETCLSVSISWNQQRGESQPSSFVLGFNSDITQLNSSKVWEFDKAHQRWLPVAELALPGDKGDQVYAVAWAPNFGRPYEVITVATCNSQGNCDMAYWTEP
ncbi:hypothetical protein L1049_022972 [Liquidambar formosana]|uniref:Uncharacterized protein n=1 Tax=Liquidambar formosana TaxID=63359 RepID=A0AAP0RES6_LIQFO